MGLLDKISVTAPKDTEDLTPYELERAAVMKKHIDEMATRAPMVGNMLAGFSPPQLASIADVICQIAADLNAIPEAELAAHQGD